MPDLERHPARCDQCDARDAGCKKLFLLHSERAVRRGIHLQPSAMGILEDFPEDPTRPSLRWAASTKTPFVVPADGGVMKDLGAGLSGEGTAFDETSLKDARRLLLAGSKGAVTFAVNGNNSCGTSHTTGTIQGSIGGDFLGASGRAQYDRTASSASRVSQVRVPELTSSERAATSARYSFSSGTIVFETAPRLGTEARAILRRPSAEQAFQERYSDYYVGGWIVGGLNAGLLVGAMESAESEYRLNAEFHVKVFGIDTGAIEYNEHEREQSFQGGIDYTGFDSLKHCHEIERGSTPAGVDRVVHKSGDTQRDGEALVARVTSALSRCCQGRLPVAGEALSAETLARIRQEGLVTDLLMLPYCRLRDYAAARYQHE